MTTSNTVLSVEEALAHISQNLQPVCNEEHIAIRSALGKILSQDVHSNINVPPYDNSAMDGYAVRAADLPSQGKVQLTLIGTSFAGKPYTESVQAGQCVRIFTGAVIAKGTDTVIMQEHVECADNMISIGSEHKNGQHVRPIGEDIKIGQVVLKKGKQLTPADIGLLSSMGIPEVTVFRRLRVAFFSTGDELCPVGTVLQTGQIYDSNRYTLHGMLTRLGVDMIDMGVVHDTPEATEQAFLSAAQCSDVIITSGGVSVGDADYVTDTLQRIGKVNFWKVAMKPGKPLTFGTVQKATFFGLPGNPVSAMVTFYQFVRPALLQMMGQENITPFRITVPCLSRLKKRPGRLEFQRGILEKNEHGELVVRSTGKQGSGILMSMSQANCFIILPKACEHVEVGNHVLVEPFAGLI